MPKKTRREKIIADYRKKLQRLPEVPHHLSMSVLPLTRESVSTHQLALDPNELSAIKQNIVKTVLLATLAIAGEIALYWFWK